MSLPVTILEWQFSRVPIIGAPVVPVDVGLGVANLAEKINNKNVQPSDVTGLGSFVTSFVGGYAYLASLGLEATTTGAKLLRLGGIATPVGAAMLVGGFGLDAAVKYAPNATKWAENQYQQLKDDYQDRLDQHEASKKIDPIVDTFGEWIDFRPDRSVPLSGVAGTFIDDLKPIVSKLEDFEDEASWKKSLITNLNELETEIRLDCSGDFSVYTYKDSNFSVVRQGDNTFALKNGQLVEFHPPIYTKGKELIAMHDVLDVKSLDLTKTDELFHSFFVQDREQFTVQYHTEPPHCGDLVLQNNGRTLMYICLPLEGGFPTLAQIDNYISSSYALT